MITTRRPNARARATATAWRWPPESVSTRWRTDVMPMLSVREMLAGLASHRPLVDEHAAVARRRFRGRGTDSRRYRGSARRRDPGRRSRSRADAQPPGCARTRRLPVDANLAGIGLQRAREDLDQRRLAGAVVADEREDLAVIEVEVDSAQCLDVAERLPQAARLEQTCGHLIRLDRGVWHRAKLAQEVSCTDSLLYGQDYVMVSPRWTSTRRA